MIRWPFRSRPKAHRSFSPAERERALRRCLDALARGDRSEAESELVGLVRSDSRDVDLYLVLGRLVHDSGDVGRSIRIHQNLLLRADLGPGQRTRALLALGADLREGGFLRRAAATFEEVLERTPKDGAVWLVLADLYEGLQDHDRALSAWERGCKLSGKPRSERDGRSSRLWLAKAQHCHQAGREDDARRAARKALAKDDQCTGARLLQGRLEAERGRSKQALAAWKAAVGFDRETDREAYPLIASTFASLDRSRDFEKWLRDRLEREPADSEARLALAGCLAERGDRSEAIVEARKILDIEPGEHAARARLGRWLMEEGRKDEAAAELLGWLDAWESGVLVSAAAGSEAEGAV